MTYMRLTGMGQKEFNDEMWHNYARLINWDIDRVRDNARQYANQWHTKLVDAGGGWQRVFGELPRRIMASMQSRFPCLKRAER